MRRLRIISDYMDRVLAVEFPRAETASILDLIRVFPELTCAEIAIGLQLWRTPGQIDTPLARI